MANFRYKAMTASGGVTGGVLEAASEADAIAQIRGLGHFPISARDAGESDWRKYLPQGLRPARRFTARTISIATQELATLLEAGLPLDRAIEILVGLEETKHLRGPLDIVLARVRDGMSLADSFAAAGIFPKSYITMVRAGELGGNLERTLRRLADYLARASAIRDTIISALIYPAILMCTAGLSIVVILVFVLPEFTPLFAQAGKALPWSTQMVMGAGAFLASDWWLILLVVAGAIFLFRRAMKNPRYRHGWDVLLLRVPVLGNLLLKMDIERFARSLGTLLSNGIALPQALMITKETLANGVVANAVGETAARLKEGENLADRLRQTGIFPAIALDLVRVGEETGRLDEMMLRQAELYEREIKHSVDRLLALLVPLLTVFMGLIVAGLIASILLAILSVNDLAI
ncbi:MAG TPA: type II secretion system F family protein [Rhizomicrobium sp.]|nr:type II secretion system F family protein [Rhizomicrobium sp.]